jgi:murein DD-endopeptidase MepM/ murein hydrolase activator NlpD
MAKVKYRFNPESLSFDKVRVSIKAWLLKAFVYSSAILVIWFLISIVFLYFFDSPKERTLIREKQELLLKYELMEKRLDEMSKVLNDMQDRDDNIYRVIFETEPIDKSIREAGFGGVNRYEELERLTNSEMVVQTAKKLDIISKRMYIQSKSYDEIIEKALNKEQMMACLPAIQPVSNKNLSRTASGYGWRIHPIYKIRKFHEGMDFTAPVGTEIYATADGVICNLERNQFRGYGNYVVIDHDFGYKTLYGHMEGFNVKLGQKVKRGDVIGYVGNTGTSTGPHLHYEVHKNGSTVNPINYYFNDLTSNEFDQIIDISSKSGQTFD